MRARLAQHTNDVISLTILMLMSIALIAGQAGAAQRGAAEPLLEVAEHVLVINIDVSFRQRGE